MNEPVIRVAEYQVNLDRLDHFDIAGFREIWRFPHIQAVLLTLYHSGTANTTDQNTAIVDLVRDFIDRRGIVFFAVTENDEPTDLHAYETSVALREAGVVPLYDIPFYAAMVKLKWATEQTEHPAELIDLLLTNMVGEIDQSRIYPEDIGKLKQLYTQNFETRQAILQTQPPEKVFWTSYFYK